MRDPNKIEPVNVKAEMVNGELVLTGEMSATFDQPIGFEEAQQTLSLESIQEALRVMAEQQDVEPVVYPESVPVPTQIESDFYSSKGLNRRDRKRRKAEARHHG